MLVLYLLNYKSLKKNLLNYKYNWHPTLVLFLFYFMDYKKTSIEKVFRINIYFAMTQVKEPKSKNIPSCFVHSIYYIFKI